MRVYDELRYLFPSLGYNIVYRETVIPRSTTVRTIKCLTMLLFGRKRILDIFFTEHSFG